MDDFSKVLDDYSKLLDYFSNFLGLAVQKSVARF
jgi:hypothetical protein